MPKIGAHMSIAGGLALSIARGEELQCESIQIFVQSNRTWKSTPLTAESIREFKKARAGAKHVKSVIAHNSYLLNLSTANEEVREKSVGYFVDVLQKCEALDIEGLITHPGSHLGAGEEVGVEQTVKSLNEVVKACPGFKTKILMENTAGQGGCVGYKFEHLARLVDDCVAPEAVGFCFDTQHAFAAGYDLRDEVAYEATFATWDKLIGVEQIAAFHLNDALKEFDCKVDRHQNLGKGFLGEFPFRRLMNDSRFAGKPMCLETDPGEEMENYRRELQMLRGYRH